MSTLPSGVRVEAGLGGLPRVVVEHAVARAEIYLAGATVTSWIPRGRGPVLWVSREAVYAPGRAVRGGVPICFPWFGPAGSPQHGFARIRDWTLAAARALEHDAGIELAFELRADDSTRLLWPHSFLARYTVTVAAKLELALTVANTGETGFTFEEALHTYFAVKDVRDISVRGLERAPYIDKMKDDAHLVEADAPVRITAETDRVYSTAAAHELLDPGYARRISVQKDASHTTVLWNPWTDKARAMKDFGDDEWPEMLCIESANTGSALVTLAPGETHSMRVRITVNDLDRFF